jgi:Zn-dependent protease
VYVFGGAARIPSLMDMRPKHEALVAAAGPISSFVLAFLAYMAALPFGNSAPWVLKQAIALNIVLAVFNTLPLFPMDGGCLLRAALSARVGRDRATSIATWTTTILGGAIAALSACLGYWNLAIVLSLVILMAHGERREEKQKAIMGYMVDRMRNMGYDVEETSKNKDGTWVISCRKRHEAP